MELQLGSSTATSDAAGRFEFASAPATYDVSMIFDSDIYVYTGLSRRDLVLRMERYSSAPARHANPTVTAPSADTDTLKTVTFFELLDPVDFNSYTLVEKDTATTFYITWIGPEAVGIRLHAFQFACHRVTHVTTGLVAYDATERRLNEGDSFNWTPEWKGVPFAGATLSADATLPPGYTAHEARLFTKPNGRAPDFLLARAFNFTDPHISFLVPDMPGATFDLEMRSSSDLSGTIRRATGLTARSPVPLLEMEPGPIAVAPPRDSMDVGVGTALQWENPAGRPVMVDVFLSKPDGSIYRSYHLVTAGTSVSIPDLSSRGITFPRGMAGHWRVYSTSATTVEDLAAFGEAHSDLPQSTVAYSYDQQFTTK